jgi:hypothetical protein
MRGENPEASLKSGPRNAVTESPAHLQRQPDKETGLALTRF